MFSQFSCLLFTPDNGASNQMGIGHTVLPINVTWFLKLSFGQSFLWFLLQTKHQERSPNCNNLLTETACVIQMELHMRGTSSGSIFIPQGREDRPVSSPHSCSTFFISLFPLSSLLSSSPTSSPVPPPPAGESRLQLGRNTTAFHKTATHRPGRRPGGRGAMHQG